MQAYVYFNFVFISNSLKKNYNKAIVYLCFEKKQYFFDNLNTNIKGTDKKSLFNRKQNTITRPEKP